MVVQKRERAVPMEIIMARMFGTDGVRGVAGAELTIELATKLGQAGAYVLTKEQEHQPTLIVGCDTRISGGMLANALMAGICSVGANAIYVGVMPTPAIAYLTRKHKVDAGVVISASIIRWSLTESNSLMETDISFLMRWRMKSKS